MAARPRKPGGPEESRPGGKQSSSYRLSPETLARIDRLSEELHIPKSAVVELAVRVLARREKVE